MPGNFSIKCFERLFHSLPEPERQSLQDRVDDGQTVEVEGSIPAHNTDVGVDHGLTVEAIVKRNEDGRIEVQSETEPVADCPKEIKAKVA